MTELLEKLEKLRNFNLIKYTGHYVLTIDKGYGSPIIFQGPTIADVLDEFTRHQEAIK